MNYDSTDEVDGKKWTLNTEQITSRLAECLKTMSQQDPLCTSLPYSVVSQYFPELSESQRMSLSAEFQAAQTDQREDWPVRFKDFSRQILGENFDES